LFSLLAGWTTRRSMPPPARRWVGLFSTMALVNIGLYWIFTDSKSPILFEPRNDS
jgi:hypothetical protein